MNDAATTRTEHAMSTDLLPMTSWHHAANTINERGMMVPAHEWIVGPRTADTYRIRFVHGFRESGYVATAGSDRLGMFESFREARIACSDREAAA